MITKREKRRARATVREATRQERRAPYEAGRIVAHNERVEARARRKR